MSIIGRRSLLQAATLSALPLGGATTASAAAPVAASELRTPADLVVETNLGRVRGFERAGVRAFKGVPYGAAARFHAPTAAAAWTGVRSSMAYGPGCPQPAESSGSDAAAFLMPPTAGDWSEDCLNLNVWTPSVREGKRPVLVWLHGGNFSTGSAWRWSAYDGENLSRRGDVVVVSVNHRLNAFGYLDMGSLGVGGEAAGAVNAGMLDIVKALEWIRDNIGRFGGDPGSVLVFGQSGGGMKVTTLMAMPSARGLFHRAVVMSGSQTHLFRPEHGARLAHQLLKELDLPQSRAGELSTLPVDVLVRAGEAAKGKLTQMPMVGRNLWSTVGWAPQVDGAAIPHDPYDPAHPLSVDVPLMVGSTLHEFDMVVRAPAMLQMTEPQFADALAKLYGSRAPAIHKAFRAAYPTLEPAHLMAIISATTFNRTNAVEQATAKAAQGGRAWLYLFAWETPVLDGHPKAFHGAELPFVFHNAERCDTTTGGGPRAQALADRMADAWIAFARSGEPGHGGLPAWPTVSQRAAPTLVFDDRPLLRADFDDGLRALVAGI